jgi:F-type H+-transporting ATPase subunit delta
MNESKISVRYAKALFSEARETGSLDTLKKDFEFINLCLSESPELRNLIQSVVVKSGKKTEIFEVVFRDSLDELTMSFLRLVLQNRREEYLPGIARYFLKLIMTEQNIESAELITVSPISEDTRKSVINLISRKFNSKVDLEERINDKIIGGFVLRVGDEQIDASIASKLERIRKELIFFQP